MVDPAAVTVHAHPDVVAVIDLYAGLLGRGVVERTRFEQVHLLAERLADGHQARHRGAFVELANWHPALVGLSLDELWARTLDRSDYCLAVARQRGYDRVEDVVSDSVAPAAPFEAAVDAMLAGEIEAVAGLLGEAPDLVRRTSHWPHHATLLHYATANGVETYRQVVPSNLPEMVSALVDYGADVNAAAHVYGADLKPLGLLLSSAHPRHAGVVDEIAGILRAAGAS